MQFDAQFLLIWLGMMSVGILFAVIGLTIIGVIVFKKDNPASVKAFSNIFIKGEMLRLVTVIAIIIAISALSFGGILKGEIVATLLSGIAGYVLGGMTKSQNDKYLDENKIS